MSSTLQTRAQRQFQPLRPLLPIFVVPQTFRHVPLSHRWQLRLVNVLKGDTDDVISLRLIVQPGRVGMDTGCGGIIDGDMLPYIALSYTWGDPRDTVLVLLNGGLFRVTRNLHSALWRFRNQPGEESTLFWIDAICINQEDYREKSIQVRRMTNIYENAQKIYVWLGPEADGSLLAMGTLHAVHDYVKQLRGEDCDREVSFTQRSENSGLFGRLNKPSNERPWIALQKLLGRAWWTRMWVVQESTCPKVPTWIVCGHASMSRKTFFSACHSLRSLVNMPEYRHLARYNFAIDNIIMLDLNLSSRATGGRTMRLFHLLPDSRRFIAADPRDKVYAVSGLASDASSSRFLEPDYSKSQLEVYCDVVRHFMETSKYIHKLDFLCYAGAEIYPEDATNERAVQVSTWPSWLPDWSKEPFNYPMPFAKLLEDDDFPLGIAPAYTASGRQDDMHSYLPSDRPLIRIDHDQLRCFGFLIGHLSDLTPLPWSEEGLETLTEIPLQWTPSFAREVYSFTGETQYAAYLRLIVADAMRRDSTTAIRRGWSMPTSMEERVSGANRVKDLSISDYSLRIACLSRCLAKVTGGGMALAPCSAQEGDQVFAIFGGQNLYVLRPEQDDTYRFIGECYVHGLMDGEALDMLNRQHSEVQEIRLR